MRSAVNPAQAGKVLPPAAAGADRSDCFPMRSHSAHRSGLRFPPQELSRLLLRVPHARNNMHNLPAGHHCPQTQAVSDLHMRRSHDPDHGSLRQSRSDVLTTPVPVLRFLPVRLTAQPVPQVPVLQKILSPIPAVLRTMSHPGFLPVPPQTILPVPVLRFLPELPPLPAAVTMDPALLHIPFSRY